MSITITYVVLSTKNREDENNGTVEWLSGLELPDERWRVGFAALCGCDLRRDGSMSANKLWAVSASHHLRGF